MIYCRKYNSLIQKNHIFIGGRKMKKIYSLILLLLLWISYSWAASIGDISFSFCNSWSSSSLVDFVVEAGEKYPICLSFSNLSEENIPIFFSFVDGFMTNDISQKKACSYNAVKYWKYFDFTGKSFLLVSWSSVIKTWFFDFPLGYSGQIHWCLVYSISSKSWKTNASMFDVVVRKANFIDWRVVWKFNRKIILSTWDFDYYIDNLHNSLVVRIPIQNKWSTSETIILTWILKNTLWYERTVVVPKDISYLTSSIVDFTFSNIPFYKGKYIFTLSGFSAISSNIDQSYIPEKFKNLLYFQFSRTVFVIPWKIIFSFLWIIFVLFLFRKIMKFILKR